MTYFADPHELEHTLVAFLEAFLDSEDGRRAERTAGALGSRARLVLRTIDPQTTVSVDFFEHHVIRAEIEDANIEIELEAEALHDILLDRLDPVQISRLYETDRLVFSGAATDLAGLVMLAGPLQPYYSASLESRGRHDLLDTPHPERSEVWTAGPHAPVPAVINTRRPWQRSARRSSPT